MLARAHPRTGPEGHRQILKEQLEGGELAKRMEYWGFSEEFALKN